MTSQSYRLRHHCRPREGAAEATPGPEGERARVRRGAMEHRDALVEDGGGAAWLGAVAWAGAAEATSGRGALEAPAMARSMRASPARLPYVTRRRCGWRDEE